MNNDELLIVLQDMFEKKVDEVKRHTGALVEDLRRDVKAVAEGHSLLNDKIDKIENKVDKLENKVDRLENKVDKLENKVDRIEGKVDKLEKNMVVVKDYVLGVDAKLNEHEMILKR